MPIRVNASDVDLSGRFVITTTVAASPALAAETIIATATLPTGLIYATGVVVQGWAAYTVGTSGTAATLRVRQTNASGTVVASTGALTGNHTAGTLAADDVNGLDTSPVASGIYVLTLQITAGAAASTVSAVMLSLMAV
jgi:hypothetical protein